MDTSDNISNQDIMNAILVLNRKIEKLTKEVKSLDGIKGFLISTGASIIGDAIVTKVENSK